MAKRAMAGQKRRGKYLVPGQITEFTPHWMKTSLPTRVEDITTHSYWVAAYWSRALSQIVTQGHTGKQTLSMEQLLTNFLNVNRTCIEQTSKVGWRTDNEMWTTAVEATRRKDPNFDLKAHFTKVTPDQITEGKRVLEESYTGNKKKQGKGNGVGVQNDSPAV